MIRIGDRLKTEIEREGEKAYPFEGCGLLLGRVDESGQHAVAILPVENSWEKVEERRTRFRIAPQELLRAEIEAADRGLDVIGVYHSHPDHPPIASARDLNWATWSGYSYLISEIRDGAAKESRSWRLRSDRRGFDEEEIITVETVAEDLSPRSSE